MLNYVLIKRGDKVESRHRIHAAVLDKSSKLIASVGNPDFATYFRSSAKPFQTLALFRSGVVNSFDFTEKEIVLVTASHNGEDFHVEGVRSLLGKIGLDESYLKCGFHLPYYPAAVKKFYREKHSPSPLFNNCSGKHAGMLAACVHNNFELATYLNPNHPHQQKILEIVAEFCELFSREIKIAVDGCGVPVYYLTLTQMAKMNVKFASATETAVKRIKNALIAHPEYLAGTKRFDTEFIQTTKGQVIAKVGAEAIQSFIFFEPEPLGIVVKCEDGQFRGAESAAIEILKQLGLLSEKKLEKLKKFWRPDLTNHSGKIVGKMVPDLEVICC